MTPQEKAKELVNSLYQPLGYLKCGVSSGMMWEHAKQCALIAVEQIIIQIHAYRILLDKTNFLETNAVHVEYWQKVKQEINKL